VFARRNLPSRNWPAKAEIEIDPKQKVLGFTREQSVHVIVITHTGAAD
jgi:hypothetical protein